MKSLFKFLILGVLLMAACTSCTGRRGAEAPKAKVYLDKGVALFTPTSFGRGCPIKTGDEPGSIVTARHLLAKSSSAGGFFDAYWSDQQGRSGYATLQGVSYAVDGATLHATGIQPFPVKTGKPTKDLYFFDYDYQNKETAFKSTLRTGKLIRLIGGYIIMDMAPSGGSSGGCIYNDQDEAIGIVVWSITLDNEEKIGIGVQFPEGW